MSVRLGITRLAMRRTAGTGGVAIIHNYGALSIHLPKVEVDTRPIPVERA